MNAFFAAANVRIASLTRSDGATAIAASQAEPAFK